MNFQTPNSMPIPVMNRIRKYLSVHYPAGMVAQPTDPRCLYLWSMLQRYKTRVRTYGRVTKPLTETLQVQVTQANGNRRQTLLNDTEVRMFNRAMDFFLFQEFIALAKQRRQSTGRWEAAIDEFQQTYDFSEEDLSTSTLKQAFVRALRGEVVGFDDVTLSRPFSSSDFNLAA